MQVPRVGKPQIFTRVVALAMRMVDRKPSQEPILTVEEEPVEYEA